MNNLTAINNLKCLATHPVGELAISPDQKTFVTRQEDMAPLTREELQRIISQTERFCQEMGRPLWIHLHNGQDGKRLGIEAGRLLHIMQGQGLKEPLPPGAWETHSVVTFIINGTEIQADRELVARASHVFEKMLFGSFSEAKEDKMALNEIDPKLFQDFIAFTEADELLEINDPNDIIALYSLAEQFQSESFEMALAKRLAKLIEPRDLQLITGYPRLFAQTASAMGPEKKYVIANKILILQEK